MRLKILDPDDFKTFMPYVTCCVECVPGYQLNKISEIPGSIWICSSTQLLQARITGKSPLVLLRARLANKRLVAVYACTTLGSKFLFNLPFSNPEYSEALLTINGESEFNDELNDEIKRFFLRKRVYENSESQWLN